MNKLIGSFQSTQAGQTASSGPRRPTFYKIHSKVQTPINLTDLYRNAGCFFIGSGPSFAKVNKDQLKKPGVLTWGVNNSPKAFRPNLWCCVDEPARFLESVWRDPTIMKFCGTGKAGKPIWDHAKWGYSKTLVQDCPNVIHITRNSQFQAAKFLTEDTINWGNNKDYGGGRSVMIASIKIMYLLGIRRVYLLGVDFKMTESYRYHFEEQRSKGAIRNNQASYHKMLSYFTQLAPYFKDAGFQIFNCTQGSELTCFPYMRLDDAIKKEIADIPDPVAEKTHGMYVPNR
jgi:hypothetical protein